MCTREELCMKRGEQWTEERTWVTLVWEDNQRKGGEKTPGIEGEMEQSELGRGIDG